MFDAPIYVTSPMLPELGELNKHLEKIWGNRYLTNQGSFHNSLEARLTKFLKVKNLSVFNNGTTALLTAVKAVELPLNSEVITTCFTFPASPHCITWNGLKPVFCDVEPDTMTIDPDKIESLITPNTSAILGVHVYGFPCDTEKIQKITQKYNLKVIYDAAHAFGTEINGRNIGTFGDISMFSFHATKLFHTVEGGCLTYNDESLKEKIYYLRNFGIKNEEEVPGIGINGKMNEIQAAVGLLNLDLIEKEKMLRKKIKNIYTEKLGSLPGIRIPELPDNTTDSLQYFVILINENEFEASREQVYEKLKENNVFSRRYFYPLCSEYEPYKHLETSRKEHLPVANKIKDQVLCLPFFGSLGKQNAEKICKIIKGANK